MVEITEQIPDDVSTAAVDVVPGPAAFPAATAAVAPGTAGTGMPGTGSTYGAALAPAEIVSREADAGGTAAAGKSPGGTAGSSEGTVQGTAQWRVQPAAQRTRRTPNPRPTRTSASTFRPKSCGRNSQPSP